jgi:xylulokinase
MGVTLSAGGAFEWLRNALMRVMPALSFEDMTALAKTAPAGSHGLLFLPYLLGERCPHVAADGRAVWIGLTSMHDASHMVRSVMEGVLLNIRSIAALCATSGLTCDEVRASGGATGEPFWLQLLADVLQREVTTVTGAAEGGAYGAVLAAGVGAGWWSTLEEAAGSLRVTSRVTPNATLASLYDARFGTYRTLYDTLRPAFQRIAAEAASPDNTGSGDDRLPSPESSDS